MSWDERIQRFSDDIGLLAEGEINLAEAGLRLAGEGAGLAGDAIGAVMEPIIPDFIEEGIAHLAQGAMETGPAKAVLKWAEENPRAARNAISALNVGSMLPGAALGKAGSKMTSYGKKASKGGKLANVSNYIDNWYAPERPLTPGEQMLKKPVGKALELAKKHPKGSRLAELMERGGNSAEAAALKTTALPKHAAEGVKDIAKHVFSPSSRALYGETGISSGSQRHVKNELAKHKQQFPGFDGELQNYNRAGEKGVAQVIYNSHINQQRGRVGDTHPVMKEITDRAFIEDYQPMSPEGMADMFTRHSYKVDTKNASRAKKMDYNDKEWANIEGEGMDPKDAAFATKYIYQAQTKKGKGKFKPGAQMVMKAPSNIESGGHFSDVVHKNPANEWVANTFKKHADADGNVSIETLFTELEKVRDSAQEKLKKSGRYRDGWRVVNPSLEHAKENGLWISGGKGGSAVTEGGVMWLQKLEPNGNTTTFMVDKHDFLEKVTKPLMGDLIAVTPPMKGNIKTQRKIKTKDGRLLKAEEHFQQAPNRKTWKGEQPTKEGGLLEQFANVKPSQRNVRGEQMKMAAVPLLGAGLLTTE